MSWLSEGWDKVTDAVGDYFSGGGFEEDARRAADQIAAAAASAGADVLQRMANGARSGANSIGAETPTQRVVRTATSPLGLVTVAAVAYVLLKKDGK